MIRWFRRALPAASIAALLLLPETQVFATTSPKALALQPSDLPKACKTKLTQVVTNAQVEATRRLTAAQMRSFGRITGYGDAYSCPPSNRIVSIQSEAVVFKSSAGAQRYYQMIVAGDLNQVQHLASFRKLGTKGLGDSSTGFSYKARAIRGPTTVYLYGIEIFRQGRYLATVQAQGVDGKWNANEVTALSRTMDSRMKRAK